MAEQQPCRRYLDIWRVGQEWVRIPEGAVCPRCGWTREAHADTQQSNVNVNTLKQSETKGPAMTERDVVAKAKAALVCGPDGIARLLSQSPEILSALLTCCEQAEQQAVADESYQDRLVTDLDTVRAERDTLKAENERLINGQDLAGLCNGDAADVVQTLAVVRAAYGWTLDIHGRVCGLVAGDMGYADTSIVIPMDDIRALNEAAHEQDIEAAFLAGFDDVNTSPSEALARFKTSRKGQETQ